MSSVEIKAKLNFISELNLILKKNKTVLAYNYLHIYSPTTFPAMIFNNYNNNNINNNNSNNNNNNNRYCFYYHYHYY